MLKTYICLECESKFGESEIFEWIDEKGEKVLDVGIYPCCPYCGSELVEYNVEDIIANNHKTM